ncbi:MAG: biopolymer transporter ExbD [Bdellovibrionaceae bacterium]|nr:biopolymer transporter ExbD [Pseudobdellovibrionaceae bacterium]
MKKKELNHELSLIAFISLLSVLICSLLLTSIWVHIGAINVKQAVGGQALESSEKKPTLWAKMQTQGNIVFQLEEAPGVKKNIRVFEVQGRDGGVNKEAVYTHLTTLVKLLPNLQTALVKPNAETFYEDIIVLMDQFKKVGLVDLGVSPL